MKLLSLFVNFTIMVAISYAHGSFSNGEDVIIATGRMPNITKDINNDVHIVYGTGDSIMYVSYTTRGNLSLYPC